MKRSLSAIVALAAATIAFGASAADTATTAPVANPTPKVAVGEPSPAGSTVKERVKERIKERIKERHDRKETQPVPAAGK